MLEKLKIYFCNRLGSVSVIVAFALIFLIGAMGSGVDYARYHILRSELSLALDSAGLAGGTIVNDDNFQTEVRKYFDLNFTPGVEPVTLTNFSVTTDGNKIYLSATATTDTTFLKLFNQDIITATAVSEVTRETSGLEIVLVMDNSGSMNTSDNGQTRLQALKAAATSLMNILFGSDESIEHLWVGLVTYSSFVNVGTSNSAWLNSLNQSKYHPTTWKGCMLARGNSLDTSETPPNSSATRFTPAYVEDYYYNNWKYSCGWYNRYTCYNMYTRNNIEYRGPNQYCPPTQILPLNSSKQQVMSVINSMVAGGVTISNAGLVWGWRVLSPSWRGYWNTDNFLPLDYDTDLFQKAVIMMTDGRIYINPNYSSAYGFLSEGKLGTTSHSDAINQLTNRFTSVCNAMKQQGIIVYTITFKVPDNTTKTLYQNCATSPEHYFDSPSNESLNSTFKKIGDSLVNLYISQ